MKQALIVLGMHRSGTSAVAGALVRLGGAAPRNLLAAQPDNPKGYWESEPLIQLNDRILSALGSTWHDWRPIEKGWFESDDALRYAAEAAEAMETEFPGDIPAVLKDPRICRLFPLWEKALAKAGRAPIVISPIRRPAEVALSLAKRDQFTPGRAYLIWLRHVLEAESATRNVPRAIFRWSEFLNDWRRVAQRLIAMGATLEIDDDRAAEVDAFLDATLRRNRNEDVTTELAPIWVKPVFTALNDLGGATSHDSALKTLDGIRTAFDTTAAIFGPVMSGLETERHIFELQAESKVVEATDRATRAEEGARQADQDHVVAAAAWDAEREALMAAVRERDELIGEVQGLHEERQTLANALAQSEDARIQNEQGWAAERDASAAKVLAFEISQRSLADQFATLSDTLAQNRLRADNAEIELERMRLAHSEGQDRIRQLSADLDQTRHERNVRAAGEQTLQTELNRLKRRRKGRPMRTAWAVLRGRED